MESRIESVSRILFPIDEQAWMDSEWGRFLAVPDEMEMHERMEAYDVEASGIYFLWRDETALLYVGMSCDIGARLIAHMKKQRIPFTHFTFINDWPPDEMNYSARAMVESMEAAYVLELEPPYNATVCPSMHRCYWPLREAVRRTWIEVDPETGKPVAE